MIGIGFARGRFRTPAIQITRNVMKALRRRAGSWTLLAALLAGGTLFGTCEMRVRDAFVEGSKSTLYQLLGDLSDLSNLYPETEGGSGS